MATSLVGSAGNGTPSLNAPSVTLPTVLDGDLGYLVVQAGTTGATLSGFTGWTVVDGPQQAGAGVNQGWLLSKTLTAAESGTTITGSVSGGAARCAAAVAVVRGSAADQITYATDASLNTTMTVPAFTPVAADCLVLLMAGMSVATGLGNMTVTPPSGYTEQVDAGSSYGNSIEVNAYVATKQLTGQAGTSQTATSATTTKNHRANVWMVTVAPASVPVSVSADASGSGSASALVVEVEQTLAPASGSGTASAAIVEVEQATAGFSGTGAATAAVSEVEQALAAFNGSGSGAAAVRPVAAVAASFSGVGTATASATEYERATAPFNGVGAASASVTTSGGTASVTATFSGNGAASATSRQLQNVTASASGTGQATAPASVIERRPAVFNGAGSATATTVTLIPVAADFAGEGNADALVSLIVAVLAQFSGEGDVTGSADEDQSGHVPAVRHAQASLAPVMAGATSSQHRAGATITPNPSSALEAP